MRDIWLSALLLVFTVVTVCGDPDLRQLLHIWRPTDMVWRHVTPECVNAMGDYTRALSERQQWASLMLDATGHPQDQFLTGNDFWLGSRLQCEAVNNQFPSLNNSIYPTAIYRVLKLKISLSEPLVVPQLVDQYTWFVPRYIWMGVCVPGACGEDAQVSAILQQMLDTAENENHFRQVQLVSIKQLPSNNNVWEETSTKLLILLCLIIGGLTVFGTMLDQLQPSSPTNMNIALWKSVLLAFSISRNFNSLFNTSKSKVTFPVIQGLRVITMTWVIYGHSCMYIFIFGANPFYRKTVNQNLLFQLIVSGTVAVDTFFFISGVLLTFVLLNHESGRSKNDDFLTATYKFLFLTLQRIIRLILPYVFTILLVSVTFRQFHNTSYFDSQMPDTYHCPESSWQNLLFINNLFDITQMCITWGWYLAVDMQLYLLALALLLVYVNGHPRTAVGLGATMLVVSWLVTALITYDSLSYPETEQNKALAQWVLSKPWMHVGAVWMGILTGWILHRGIPFQFSKINLTMGWICCAAGIFSAVFSEHWRHSFDSISIATFLALKTTIWGASIAWVLLTCTFQYAGFVRTLLELPVFLPFGRVTYCAYLLHIPITEWLFINLEGPMYMSYAMLDIIWAGIVCTSFAFGTVVSLVFESPVIRLLQLLRNPRTEKLE